MSRNIYIAEPYLTDTQLTNGAFSQRFKLPDYSAYLKAVRTWVVLYGNPSFINLQMKIYSDNATTKDRSILLYTSTNSWTKAQIASKQHGIRGIYFTFNDIPLKVETFYHLVLFGTPSSFSSTSHLAWKYGANSPVYPSNFGVLTTAQVGKKGFDFALIGVKECRI